MKVNPFYYGEVVTGENFTDRIDEIERLTTELCGGHNVFLISPRRFGKTSLIINTLEQIKKRGLFVFYMDLYRVASIRELLEACAKGIVQTSRTKVEKISDFVKDLFPKIRPKIILGDDGIPSIEVDIALKDRELMDSLSEILDAPQKIAEKRKTNFVIVFDEFQEIVNLDGARLEKLMRASFQHHHNVAYLFAGSKRHLLLDMVSDPNRAFYKLGDIMNLHKIPPDEMMKFVKKKFSEGPINIGDEVIDSVLETSENVPYNIQYLCHHLWNRCLQIKDVKKADIDAVMTNIINEQSANYISIWDGLSMHQRLFLKAIIKSPERSIFSKEFVSENELGTPGSIQKSISLLTKKNVIEMEDKDIRFNDVFFKEWIKNRMIFS
jgi:AAA+ ATPase superfamily predicted ATPase